LLEILLVALLYDVDWRKLILKSGKVLLFTQIWPKCWPKSEFALLKQKVANVWNFYKYLVHFWRNDFEY